MKRFRVRTPTRNVIREKRERKAFSACAMCKQPIHGMPAGLQGVSKTKKKPSRAYGGYMCASCSREFFREQARSI